MKNTTSSILLTTGRVTTTGAAAIGTGFLTELLPDCVPDPVKTGLVVAGGCLGDIIARGVIGGALCKHESRKLQKMAEGE